jgi:anthranilate synthase component II
MFVLIDNYDSFTYNLAHYFAICGAETRIIRNDESNVQTILNGKQGKPKAIILSPGPCAPKDAGVCMELIRAADECIPIFGVCLGCQAIGEAYGGKTVRAPEPVHGQVKKIKVKNNFPLFRDLPEEINVTRYHSLVTERATLPPDFLVIAESAEPGEEGLIMALTHETRPVCGVQFHPESVKTEDGIKIIKNFLEYYVI